jgi:hypothetical protein
LAVQEVLQRLRRLDEGNGIGLVLERRGAAGGLVRIAAKPELRGGALTALRARHGAAGARVFIDGLKRWVLGKLLDDALRQLHGGHLEQAIGQQELRISPLLETLRLKLSLK